MPSMFSRGITVSLASLALFAGVISVHAADSQKKKVVFVAGTRSHGYGSHEHNAGCLLLARELGRHMPNFETSVFRNGWPKDPESAFKDADAVVMYCDGGGGHMVNPHLEEFDKVMKRGVGLACIHYAVEVPKGESGNAFLDWIGGYFETHWSVNPHWKANFDSLPDHPITRGVKPFEIQDEWYFHMRFREGMKGVTPILTALAPDSTMSRRDGAHSGNPHVRRAVAAGEPQHVAWAAERPDGGRGFGFTGGHFHWNWGDENFRRLVLNAIVWIAKGDVAENGVASPEVTRADLEANQDYPKPQKDNQEARSKGGQRDPSVAIAGLDVHEGVSATLFASEPLLLSPSNIDVDHLGRVWVCEVVNYRGHNGKRAEGDRILVLEDTDHDGRADKQTVFYQGVDVNSALGICVFGNKVIVSCAPNVFIFHDDDGDLEPDRKELFFTKVGQPQHDHSAHAFVFGPDGKLYWNFGNTGRRVHDKEGKVVVDQAGNEVVDNGKPYFGGMVFRCNPDGSDFEVLAHNFRNNYEVAVDSFGTLWQSDNDDDGNQGVRLNFVMEFGNYGYRDEMTGATWRTARTGWRPPRSGWDPEIPIRHWHLHDPGVVPNLIQTGGGSPCGICVHEGEMLPSALRNLVLHCDAGPNVTWAIRAEDDGAGYQAETVDILRGTRDKWFRPCDVCVAPDGSLIIADWYDPGVGGHAMGDLTRGRLFRVAAHGQGEYATPKFDFDTAAGAVVALKNPNLSVRSLAWTSLHAMGEQAEEELLGLWESDNPRFRARALWLLGKIKGQEKKYVELAITDNDPNIRITGLRLARQLKLDLSLVLDRLVHDSSPAVRRECAIALRHGKTSDMPEYWATLAQQFDGQDRWYLEALGIGAHDKWDECLNAWLARVGGEWDSPAGHEIIWRSRAAATPTYLAKLLTGPLTIEQATKLLRAFDFQNRQETKAPLLEVATASSNLENNVADFVLREVVRRLPPEDIKNRPELLVGLDEMLQRASGTEEFIRVVQEVRLKKYLPQLLKLAQENHQSQLGVDAIRVLLDLDGTELVKRALAQGSMEQNSQTIAALSRAGIGALSLLMPIVQDESSDLEIRRQATSAVAATKRGAEELIRMAGAKQLDARLREAAAFRLNAAPWSPIRDRAAELFPLPVAKDDKPLPPLTELMRMTGDSHNGKLVFAKQGTCSKCHVIGNDGKQVGPSLTEIGSKLSRQALWESILFPSAGISHNYETHLFELEDGNVLKGIVVSETEDTITVKSDEAIEHTIPKPKITQRVKQPVSLMPADLHKSLSLQELADVIEYMTTLKKSET